MANKEIKTRIQNKNDTSENWAKAVNFIPLKGEIIVYTDLRKIKIGDGVTKVGALEFANSKDAETLTGASLSTILNHSDVEIPTSKAVLDALDGKVPNTRTVNGKALSTNITLSASDIHALPDTTLIPTKTSELTNDSGFLTQHQSLDNYATIEYVNSNAPTAITNAKIDEICGATILLAEDVAL